ncbi:ATP-binding domain-containing protein [Gottschalkia purinilytica]|uniref:ATP-binding domain-containing protein n=1 Tax=Gottschalkia purinilytica TaxID=1503 RepID=A0A0L0WC18_GOTPU|nr:ABC transporter permease [Gottschalkia purinilytica]KNF09019.1 ATP-binding domain-containing protein [Gottschalkia purinilytica]
MRTYVKLALAYLKKQKGRTFAMVLGVSLAVMLVFGFDVTNESQSKKQLKMIYHMYGGYDGTYSNLSKDKLEKIKNDKDVKESSGVASLGSIVSENGTFIKLDSSDKKYIEMTGYSIKKGRLPSKNDEIVLESQAMKYMKLEEKLNQNIEFKVKKEYKDENGINQIFMETKSFKLVGIISKPDYYYKNWYQFRGFTYFKEGETSILPQELISYESIVKLKSKTNARKILHKILGEYKINPKDLTENEILVMALSEYSLSGENDVSKNIKRIIVVTSIILIYNMFNISLMDMIKQIGLFRVVGISKRKIRLIIGIQSVVIFIIGTLLGLIFGLAFSYFGIKMFNSNFIDIHISRSDMYVSMKHIVKAIKISAITVLLSSIVPIWISGRISPLEALRKTDKLPRYRKKRFYHRAIRKLFGTTGEMAYRNIGRNKFRALVSIIAISMGGILFINNMAVLSNDSYMYTRSKDLRMQHYSLTLYSDMNSDDNFTGYTKKDVEKMAKMDGVKDIKTKINLRGFLKLEVKNLEENYVEYRLDPKNANNNVEIGMLMSGYDNKSWNKLKKYTENGKVPEYREEEYPNAVVCNYYYNGKTSKPDKTKKNLKIGDILTIKVPVIEEEKVSYKEQKVRVGAFLKDNWVYEGDSSFGSYFEIIVPDKYVSDISNKNTYNEIFLETEKEKENDIYNELKDKFKGEPLAKIESKTEEQKIDQQGPDERKREYQVIVALILFIAGINIFGTIKTSLLIRTNEFALLRAIGMTNRRIRNMIIKETLIYGILSSIVAAIVGSYKYYEVISFYNNQIKEAFNIENISQFNIPIVEILQFTTITIIICIIVAYISKRKIEKMNIVEGLKVTE